MQVLEIAKKEDKKTVVAILAENGYTVSIRTVTDGKRSKSVVCYEKNKKEKINE